MLLVVVAMLGFVSSCSDEPDSSNFYTFKGQMMSEYLQSHDEFSDFATIVERAGMMDLLATYGAYTCFPPTNDAVQAYLMQDDSVENGIMQPITEVLESSNRMIIDVMKTNPNISLYVAALELTGLADSLFEYKDATWDHTVWPRIRYTSHVNKETATVPDEKRYGFTVFVPTDSTLRAKYNITTVEDLYKKACEIYDEVYPEDANADYHDFAHIKHPKNPLYRFLAYHILDRDVKGWNYLTPYTDIGILTTVMNPIDWYETITSTAATMMSSPSLVCASSHVLKMSLSRMP